MSDRRNLHGATTWGRFSLKTPTGRLPVESVEIDPTCPECEGDGQDRHGFDCRRCFGEGIVDE